MATPGAERTSGASRDFLSLSAVVAIGLGLAVSAFMATRGYYQALDRQQFRRSATYYATSFKDDVARHVTSLAAIRAFVSASRGVTRWEFSTYAHQILPQNPGFHAVLWVPSISRQGRSAYETGLQQDGLYGLGIRELTGQGQIIAAGDRSIYLPISYVEPFEGNDKLVGLDLSQLPSLADMFRAAGRTGRIAGSTPVSQALVAGTQGPAIFLAFPLSAAATTGLGATTGAPQGYAVGVLQPEAIMRDVSGTGDAPLEAAIAYQDNPHAPPLVFASDSSTSAQTTARWFKEALFHQTISFDIADRHFLLALRSTSRADPVTGIYVPAGASLLVLTLTALLAQNMFTTILRKRLVEEAVISRTAELRTANESLQSQVEQRRQAEEALRVARDKAESANRAKSAFMANMSHELRTPLNAIIGFSSILGEDKAGLEPRHRDYAHEIQGSGERLLDLINDILDLTQMEAAAGTGGDTRVYLSDCIAAVVAGARPAAIVAGVLLRTSVADSLPAIYGDNKRLTKALSHLVSNAIKFNPSGGAILIVARRNADGTLNLDVCDTGVGMPPDAIEQIQQAFSQYDGKLGRKYAGVGLGLTYVAKVAELHEATLSIVSEAGKGTRARLTFQPHRIARDLEVA